MQRMTVNVKHINQVGLTEDGSLVVDVDDEHEVEITFASDLVAVDVMRTIGDARIYLAHMETQRASLRVVR